MAGQVNPLVTTQVEMMSDTDNDRTIVNVRGPPEANEDSADE